MSGNQKQAPSVVPQPQSRYPAPYIPRPPTPQRTDGFHVAGPQQFVQQQQPPNQAGNQAPGLRAMAPTGPPTQASTPPNADLKVSHVPQQPMNIAFVPRSGPNYYPPRGPPPQPNQSRMVNSRQNQQQMYSQSQIMMAAPMQPLFFNTPMPMWNNTAQRAAPTYVTQNFSLIPGTQLPAAAYSSYQPSQSQQYYFNQLSMQRAQPPQPQVTTVPQNMAHPPPQNVPMTQASQQNTLTKPKSKRRCAIPIIDPVTGKEVVNDEDHLSHPPSGESSARQTPQPAPSNPSKEVQATFAKQVAQVLSDAAQEEADQAPPPIEHHIVEPSSYHSSSQAVHITNRNNIMQSSTLQVPTKDFVPANQMNTAKETPVVSANSNAVEVTITNKPKDRESPAKGRKQRERDASKEIAKETISQPEKAAKEDKPKEVASPPAVSPAPPKEVKEKEVVKEEKKSSKKDKATTDSGKVSAVVVQEVVSEVPVQPSLPPPAQDNAKAKNSQKGKEPSKQTGAGSANPKQPAPVAVPQTQPSKPNNKSNKMKELNMKGATKEGTDMDAFNDIVPDGNAANDGEYTTTTTAAPDVNSVDSNKKESNDVPTTIKTEVKPVIKEKEKFDITAISYINSSAKPYAVPPPKPVESKDEPDRVSHADKLVQAKNEANTKMASDNNESVNLDIKNLPYKENQWSPYNKSGKKVYEPDFLLSLRFVPQSKEKPSNILNDIALDDKSRQSDMNRGGYMMSGRTDFVPPFGGGGNFAGGKSQSQRGMATKRSSQQGKIGGNSKGGKSGSVIRVSISFKEDVKLHETENAWKPARLNSSGGPPTDEDRKTEELYKRVRGVLNKLTPQKFKPLLNQIKTLPIDTSERLQGVIDLVFEKAVDEPNFSVAYALMCRELALMQVPVSNENKDFVNFRKLLITRCQLEFEKNSTEERNRNDKLNDIEACTDPEKKKELTLSLEEDDRRIRMKSVGNIRFIGELFKQQMLTVSIMMRCLQNLLENKDEERLECLCKLLTTIGKELDTKKVDIEFIFGTMKDIVEKKDSKVSSRVRFMLQDVIDLRASGWVPRRTDLNPKTIDQIKKEAENEQLTIQAMNSTPITPRKDERNSGPNSERKRGGGRNISDDGWSTAHSRGKNTPFTVQSDKLKFKQPTIDEPFGSSQMFGNWGRGSNCKHNPPPATNTANMYAALEKIDVENKSMSSRPSSKDPYNSKGPSLERTYKQYEGRGSRSGSQHRSNDSSQRSTPAPPVPAAKPQPEPIDPELITRKMNLIVQEYYTGCSSIEDSKVDIETSIPASAFEKLVFDVSLDVAEKTSKSRVKTGELFAHLIGSGVLPLDTYCTALEKIFALAEDLIVDLPMIWDCFAELISAPITTSTLPLDRLHKCCKFISLPGQGKSLLRSLLKHVIQDKGPNILINIWKASNMKFEDFMPENEVESFISNNKFEFLIGNSAKIASLCKSKNFTYPQIYDKLLQFIKQDKDKKSTPFDDVSTWITANIGDDTKEEEFVRTLATVIIECSITSAKLDVEQLRSLYPYLHKYIDNQPAFELQCLYAIQSIVNKLEHPQGLLLNLFNTLYEDNIISHDSFINWEQSDDPQGQEKKGVALKQLTSFFTQLKENDEDTGGSSGSDEPYTAD